MGFESGFKKIYNSISSVSIGSIYLGRLDGTLDSFIISNSSGKPQKIKGYDGAEYDNEDEEYICNKDSIEKMATILKPIADELRQFSNRELYLFHEGDMEENEYFELDKRLKTVRDLLFDAGLYEVEKYSNVTKLYDYLNAQLITEELNNKNIYLIYWRSY